MCQNDNLSKALYRFFDGELSSMVTLFVRDGLFQGENCNYLPRIPPELDWFDYL